MSHDQLTTHCDQVVEAREEESVGLVGLLGGRIPGVLEYSEVFSTISSVCFIFPVLNTILASPDHFLTSRYHSPIFPDLFLTFPD